MGGNFLEMSERTSPVDKGPVVSHHWSPLFLCSSLGIYRSMHVFFSLQVLVLPNVGQLIPFWVFQFISTWT